MVKLRLVSVGSEEGKAEAGRKTYVVPFGLVLPTQPQDATTTSRTFPSSGTETNDSRTPSTRPGKSKYILCHAATFRRLLAKKGMPSSPFAACLALSMLTGNFCR
jgi:hypothetical protein